jgi:clan AA aspartic protease
MIRGIIVALQGRIQIRVRGHDGEFKTIEAIVDTGFNGWHSLPASLIAGLGLRWESEGHGVLADGSESEFNVFEATLVWHGRTRQVSVVASETVPLIGMAMLEGNELNMKVRERGAVTIKSMRRRRRLR